MQLGIFAKTFVRPTLEETLDAVVEHGFTHVQFNMSCVGLPTLPECIPEEFCTRIAAALRERGLTMAAISGTFNMLRPREEKTATGTAQPVLIDYVKRIENLAACRSCLGTRIITLCTGTFDPDDMWRWHPRNVSRAAWTKLVVNLKTLAVLANRYEAVLAFEPEVANVVNSACKARRLLDEVGSPWLKVVIDPANLLRDGDGRGYDEILEEAFELLGPDIALAHAKEWKPEGEHRVTPFEFAMPFFDDYLRLLLKHGYGGPLIMHGLPEEQVASKADILRTKLAQLTGEGTN